ncbi:MCU domain-containing protein [Mycena kentingensis (nom. inval.)]|nr:MCU domain-containing protein [Mycena kentingensis (nom. inval.)]
MEYNHIPAEYAHDIALHLEGYYLVEIAALTILIYDSLLTLDSEITAYWSKPCPKFSLAKILFFLNRYGVILGYIVVSFMHFWTAQPTLQKEKVCHVLSSYLQYFAFATQLTICVALMLRTYAIYNHSKRILIFMIACTLCLICLFIYGTIDSNSLSAEAAGRQLALEVGCLNLSTQRASLGPELDYIALILFDFMIFLLTLYRTISLHNLTRRIPGHVGGNSVLPVQWFSPTQIGGQPSLSAILTRDGTVYFALLAAANISNLLTFVFGTVGNTQSPQKRKI